MTKKKKPSDAGQIFAINYHFLFAFGFGFVAWNSWPDRMEHATWGILSFVMWGPALGLAFKGFELIKRRYSYIREELEFSEGLSEIKAASAPSEEYTSTEGVINNDR